MGDPLVQELPALVGVIVGGAATYLVTFLGDRTRWRRERDERWDTARMQSYAEFADSVKEVFTIATRVAGGRGIGDDVDALVMDATALEALYSAEARRARAWESVLLLGAPATVEAGRAWWHEVWRFVWFARGWLTDPAQWEEAREESDAARQKFYACARRDLGVAGAAVAIGSRHPRWLSEQTAADFRRGGGSGNR